MERVTRVLLLLAALAACASPKTAPPAPAAPAPERPAPTALHFVCPNGLDALVEFRDGAVEVRLEDGRSFELSHVPAASGAKYSDGTNLFWEHRGAALIELEGQRLEDCSAE